MKNIVRSIFKSALKAHHKHTASSLHELVDKESGLWARARQQASVGPRILIATSMGCYNHAIMLESVLAVALTLRGAHVDILLCDQLLPCCQMTKVYNVSPDALITQDHTPRCPGCQQAGADTFEKLGLPVYWYSKLLRDNDLKKAATVAHQLPFHKIDTFKYDDLSIGEHASAGVLRYYARGDLDGEPHGETILRRYLKASMLTALAVTNLLTRNTYDTAVFHHGIYVPQGIIGEVCRRQGVHVINWNPSYRKQTFIFSHDDSYHHTMITEPVSQWENIRWTKRKKKITLDYLKSRWHGTQDWIWFHERPIEDIDEIGKQMGIDFSKPCIGMLSSVMWDAQLHYKSNAFKNMLDWVFQTIDYFERLPKLQLIIRVHPAEITGMIPSRQKLHDEIKNKIPKLPKNIFIIPPESKISTYAVMEKCNAVIIYNTKAGIEISSMGIPVIVAGEAWIREKGFSIDASSPEEYFEILDRLPLHESLSKKEAEQALKYAFHFFFRRMIELPFIISPQKYKFALDLKNLKELLPERFAGLDVICDGILLNKPFVMNADGRK
jgi:hypothetical protein